MNFKRVSNIFTSTIFIINIVSILILLLSAFSDQVSPNKLVIFAYLGIGFPFILIINICFTIWWIIVRRWIYLSICFIALLICSGAIFTYLPIHTKTKNVPEDCIKVLTYNVMRFVQFKKHTEKNPNNLILYILEKNADIVCIQEYGSTRDNYLITDQDINNVFKKKYPYRKVSYSYRNTKGNGQSYGVAVYSKFPIKSVKEIPFNSIYNSACAVELNIKGKHTLLVNAHLESNRLSVEDRSEYTSLFREIKEMDSKRVDEIGKKMAKRLAPAYKIRAIQAETIAKVIEESKAPYTIVCGDFNDTPISYSRRTVKGDLIDSFVESGRGLGISYNQNRFWFRIDYIMHSKNMKSYNCTVDQVKYSDHYPVWTYLQFKE